MMLNVFLNEFEVLLQLGHQGSRGFEVSKAWENERFVDPRQLVRQGIVVGASLTLTGEVVNL